MWQFSVTAWRAGMRSRSIQGVFVVGLLLVGVAFLSASFSPRQPTTVALDVGLSGVRFSLILFALAWVQELVGREIERRTVVYALTYPVARSQYVVGRYLGIFGLLGLAALLLGLLLWLAVLVISGGYEQGFRISLGLPYWATLFGLWLDAAVVTAFALCIATLSTVPLLPIALGAAFAIGGKSLGAVTDYLTRGGDGDAQVLRFGPAIDAIHWVLPDLSRLDWRIWPMYGVDPGTTAAMFACVMALGYILLMLALAVFSFGRREF